MLPSWVRSSHNISGAVEAQLSIIMSMPPATPTLKLVGEPGSDFITDMRYDYYGRRLATTSAEGVVRIRDMDENGEWCLQEGCELKATHAVRRGRCHVTLEATSSLHVVGIMRVLCRT